MLNHTGLGITAIQNSDLATITAVRNQASNFLDEPLGFEQVCGLLNNADLLALALLCPKVFTEPTCVVTDQGIGRIKDMTKGSIILFETDDRTMGIITLKIRHIANICTTKSVDRLIIVTHRKQMCPTACQQGEPFVLQRIGVLKLVNQNVFKAALIVLTNWGVSRQQLIGTQQQFRKVNNAFTLTLCLVKRIDLDQTPTKAIVSLDITRSLTVFFGTVDKTLHISGWIFVIIHTVGF